MSKLSKASGAGVSLRKSGSKELAKKFGKIRGAQHKQAFVVQTNKKQSTDKALADDIDREESLSARLVGEIEHQSSDVRTLCDEYGLKRDDLGRLTGFSLRALAEWSAGKLPSQPAQRRLNEVRRLLDALAQIVRHDAIPAWLHQPNRAFDGVTPLQAIELGQIDRLWEMVHDMRSGQPE